METNDFLIKTKREGKTEKNDTVPQKKQGNHGRKSGQTALRSCVSKMSAESFGHPVICCGTAAEKGRKTDTGKEEIRLTLPDYLVY